MANWRSIAIAFVVFLVAAAVGASRLTRRSAHDRQRTTPDALVQITPHRIPMSASMMELCISPQIAFGPHSEAGEVHIYANEIALGYRREHSSKWNYPVGSKFLKEKYSRPGDMDPDIATIMERVRKKGDISDWSSSMVALPDKTPLVSKSPASCAECHERYADTGYVSIQSEEALKKYLELTTLR